MGLIAESKKAAEMSTEELVELAFSKQKDRELLWLQLKKRFTQEDLEKIAEEEFADLVAAITEREIVAQVESIQEEAQFQIKDAKHKMQKEINVLRMQLANRSEDIEKLKLAKLVEVDRAREEGYNRCEQRLVGNMRVAEARFNAEREGFQREMREAQREDQARINRLYVQGALTKWRLLIQIGKLKAGMNKELTLENLMGAIQKGNTNVYID